MGNKPKFYITTAIYYSNAEPHIGSTFEAIGADVLARWKRLMGYDVLFLTGMDEHSQKTVRTSQEMGLTPEQLIDDIAGKFQQLWANLGISYDDFIRTTEPRHKKVVTEFFKRVHDAGDIYKGTYSGWYCVGCENYLSEEEIVDDKCPAGHTTVEWLSEETYFFRMSKYTDAVRRHIEEHPDFVQPDFRRNEIMNSFVLPGLKDKSITRSTIQWGVPVPAEAGHVVYVWFDALVNYLTGCGFLADEDEFAHYWPADVHIVGKDIIQFHTTLWPAMLMAAGLPLPRKVFGHGFINLEGGKMSKSAGTVVAPGPIIEKFGADVLRYFLLREVPYALDGSFSLKNMVRRVNSDLGNDLGNLLHRTLTMLERYRQGVVPKQEACAEGERLRNAACSLPETIDSEVDGLRFNKALEQIWEVIRGANRYVEESKPWVLAKDPAQAQRLSTVLYTLLETVRLVSVCLWAFMPGTSEMIRQQLGLEVEPGGVPTGQTKWGLLKPGVKVNKGEPLFPRVELPGEFAGRDDEQ